MTKTSRPWPAKVRAPAPGSHTQSNNAGMVVGSELLAPPGQQIRQMQGGGSCARIPGSHMFSTVKAVAYWSEAQWG